MRMFNIDRGNQRRSCWPTPAGGSACSKRRQAAAEFNQGKPVRTQTYPNVHAGSRIDRRWTRPGRCSARPAIGDIDGDLEAEIVDSAGEHVYAWHLDGKAVKGFPVRLDPGTPGPRTAPRQPRQAGLHRLAHARATSTGWRAGDLRRRALDQHMYAWNGQGEELDGLPGQAQEDGTDTDQCRRREHQHRRGGRHRRRRAARDRGATNENGECVPTPGDPQDAFGLPQGGANARQRGDATGRMYALDADGTSSPAGHEARRPAARHPAVRRPRR